MANKKAKNQQITEKTPKLPKKSGRPTKLTPKMKKQLEKAYKLGLTDLQVSEIIGVDESTIYNWAKRAPVFFKAIKDDWKKKADHEIERSLRERAIGYEHPETKVQWVQDQEGGRWETIDMVKHYPPDPTSMIFWLKNRQPGKWRDKMEHGISANIIIDAEKIEKVG